MKKTWEELYDRVIEGIEFQERSCGTCDQVMTDLLRLGEHIADLEERFKTHSYAVGLWLLAWLPLMSETKLKRN